MEKSKKTLLISGDVKSTLVKLTVPMIFGMLGLIVFNLVDTYFVGKLGINELAALTFTFPVILIINSIALGIGVGASAVISNAVGEGNHYKVERLTTDSLLLSVILVIIFVVLGVYTIEPVFSMLGVNSEIMPIVKQYMQIWYFGVVFIVIPMVGNAAIRSLGDTKTPSVVMMTAAVINVILDPLLIFGIGIFPRLGVAGAAIATVIARAFTMFVSLYILIIREKIVSLKLAKVSEILDSWKRILYIGLPNALTKMVAPVAAGVITSLMATYGKEAVAGYGVATRLERFAIILVASLAVVIPAFVGQNYGAKKLDRITLGIKLSEKFSIISNVIIFLILAVMSKPLAGVFSDNSAVISVIVRYLWIVPIGYGFQGILLISTAALNALNKPMHSAALIVFQMVILYIPLSFIGSKLFGITGIFGALIISYFIAGTAAHFVLKKELKI